MYRPPRKVPPWKRVPCAGGCGGWGDYWFNGRGLLCCACWDSFAPAATAGRAHQLSQRDQELEGQLRELDRLSPQPMARNHARVVVRSCQRCRGAVEWIHYENPRPGEWEGTCVACARVVVRAPAAVAS